MKGDILATNEVGISLAVGILFCGVAAPFGEGSAKEWTEVDRGTETFEA